MTSKTSNSANFVLEQSFSEVVSQWSLPLMILDREYRFVFANKAYLETVDRSWEQIAALHVFEAFPEDAEKVEAVFHEFNRAFAGATTRLSAQPFILKNAKGEAEIRNWQAVQEPCFNKAGDVTHIVQYSEDVTGKVRAHEERELISEEMNHRVKNMLAIIQSVARMTSKGHESVEDYSLDLIGRIGAIGRNYSRLLTAESSGMNIKSILIEELDIFSAADGRRYSLSGDDLILGEHIAKDLSMIIHELATNAVKYGCFAKDAGQLDVSWTQDDDNTVLIWQERGVGPIGDLKHEGFGSKLLRMIHSIKTERRGTEEGMRAQLTIPRKKD